MAPKIKLRELLGTYAICRLDCKEAIPPWADGDGFVSISRTAEELSIVCLPERVPANIKATRNWRCFQFAGTFAFEEAGIALSVIRPISESGLGIFLVSTFDTDYLLVQEAQLKQVKEVLLSAGHLLL
jgi:hypothetical protein